MAVKKINIITSLCGAGLEREAILLRSLLSTHGIESNFIHYCGGPNERMERADLNICLEVICPQAFSLAPQTWLAPNCEWWPSINEQYLPRISKILSKTQDCQRIWSAKVGADKCIYTSFEARDLYRPEVPRHDVGDRVGPWCRFFTGTRLPGKDKIVVVFERTREHDGQFPLQ